MDGLIPVSVISLDRESNLGRLKTTEFVNTMVQPATNDIIPEDTSSITFYYIVFINVLDLYVTFLNYS